MFIFKMREPLRCLNHDRKNPIKKEGRRNEIINIVESPKGTELALERRGASFLL